MKKYSKTALHRNFILIHDFFYDKEPMKAWVRKDTSYNGSYHTDIDFLIQVIRKIGDRTGYELVMYYGSSYWNKFGTNPLEKEFGGYEETIHIYEAIVEFLQWRKFARHCDECKQGMNAGYCIGNGREYYCTDKCLRKHYTKKEYLALHDNGVGDSYWTEWDPDAEMES